MLFRNSIVMLKLIIMTWVQPLSEIFAWDLAVIGFSELQFCMKMLD